MKTRALWILLAGATLLPGKAAELTPPPNIVFVVADDLGYGDLGCNGQQHIRTPHLDRLAAEGMRLTRHYAGNAVCAPSRCVLMTGLHPGHAPVRDNREARPEGQWPLPEGTATVARLLQLRGYVTGAFGKWGLGGPGSTGDPLRQGFDRFFGYNCQRHAHNYYPTYLWDNDRRVPLDNPESAAHAKLPADADPTKPESYRSYSGREYAPDRIAEQARRFIREHRDRPFFLFFPTTVPHLALQVPEDSLAEYAGQFPEEPYVGDRAYLPHRTPRAAYAAMVTRMDREIGSLMTLVASLGLDERTVFVFTSDNGPLYNRLGGTDCEFFQSAGAFRGRKGSLYEGGVRVPCIVRWPGRIPRGTESDRITGFEDWLPTLLDLAGHAADIPKGLDGLSFVPTLRGEPQPPRPWLYREFAGYGGQQSVRQGNWKAVRQQLAPAAPARTRGAAAPPRIVTELYDLDSDPAETRNVAARHPEVLDPLERILRAQHTPSAAFPLPALDNP
ncbi:MAG TPA: arylsulfatase [Verrucomicrobiota bacterium]|nr:arylsulfatase [Verrucomicrobiota bacterium]HNU52193.1 arylsulfatase [Verrucomicrobiota bacterium]